MTTMEAVSICALKNNLSAFVSHLSLVGMPVLPGHAGDSPQNIDTVEQWLASPSVVFARFRGLAVWVSVAVILAILDRVGE